MKFKVAQSCLTLWPRGLCSPWDSPGQTRTPKESQADSLPTELAIREASLVAQMVKCLPTIQETRVWSLGWEDRLEKGMATHSSILTWRIPWREEPGGLQSTGVAKSWTKQTIAKWCAILDLQGEPQCRMQAGKGGWLDPPQGSLVYPEGPSLHHIPSQSWVQQLGYNTESTMAKEKADK